MYKKTTVLEEARDRIRFLFDEFDEIIVQTSGGKDSTVIYELCKEIAIEKNRLPIRLMWIDQEAEWQGTEDYVSKIMRDPDVIPMWFQMPMVITNNASSENRYNNCWAEGEKWIREQSDISIKENKYKEIRFHNLFEAIMRVEMAGKKACYIAGVRTEESPKRLMALTSKAVYKWATWGKKYAKKTEHYVFYPIYDWSYTDVWKYIHEKKAAYNAIYDKMHQHGVDILNMRVSNLHHETAIQSLLIVQEIEPETWVKLSARIDGANTIKHLKKHAFTCPKEIPYMFASWEEYGLYLLDNMVKKQEDRSALMRIIEKDKAIFTDEAIAKEYWVTLINTVLSNDFDTTKLTNFRTRFDVYTYIKYKKGKIDQGMLKYSKYLKPEWIDDIKRRLNEQRDIK